jgi:endonuclease YncB( thermonuclease family)
VIRELLAAFVAGFSSAPAQPVTGPGLVYVYVSDGDTLKLPNGEKIRALGFDAPEVEARCDREYRLAALAASRMWELASHGLVIERSGKTDRYGRTLATVRTAQGTNVADIMVAAGLARPYAGGRRGSWCE